MESAPAPPPHRWTLRPGADKRFRAGHPWVYSNELAHSPRVAADGTALAPGDAVELRDANGGFLARGYGHPGTLIAFRALSRDAGEAEPWSRAGVLARLRRAAALRAGLGLGAVSHRLVFGEADELPGLVVERYRLAAADGGPAAQMLVLQEHTAGAERLHDALLEALEALVGDEHAADPGAPGWERTGLLLRNDVAARRLEDLPERPDMDVRVLRALPGVDAARAEIVLADASGAPGAASAWRVDLLGGQKTGFYLDQAANVRLAAQCFAPLVRQRAAGADGAPLRILDLFAYVGQWGAQLARTARFAAGAAAGPVQVTVLDASAAALELAAANVTATGAACEPVRADALAGPDALPGGVFDAVLVDPPAFIKGRKAYHAGRAAYVKLHSAALRRVRPGGLYVACSCSQLLDEADFAAVLHKAAGRAGVTVRWVARGGQAPDHPVLAGFPEGHYLKCWIGCVG